MLATQVTTPGLVLAHTVLGYLGLGVIAVVLSVSDIRTKTLPTRIMALSVLVVFGWQLTAAISTGEFAQLTQALVTGSLLFCAALVLALIRPEQLGGGDVKLFGLVGLVLGWCGWGALLVALISLTGFLVALFVFLTVRVLAPSEARRARAAPDSIPLAPILLSAMWLGIALDGVSAGAV